MIKPSPNLIILCGLFFSGFTFAVDTQISLYNPFEELAQQKKQKVQNIAKRFSGNCLQNSQKIDRNDAWRCQYQNGVLDPCFIKEYSNHKLAICPKSPWTLTDIIYLDLENPIATGNAAQEKLDVSKSFPWGVKLTEEVTCMASENGGLYDKQPIRYVCSDQSHLFGSLQRCKEPWSILQEKNGKVEAVNIEEAWF